MSKHMGRTVRQLRFQASSWNGQAHTVEARVRLPLINRVCALGLMPSELIIGGGGFTGSVPRNKPRSRVNLLLQSPGEPLLP